jgi:hypothetical protein
MRQCYQDFILLDVAGCTRRFEVAAKPFAANVVGLTISKEQRGLRQQASRTPVLAIRSKSGRRIIAPKSISSSVTFFPNAASPQVRKSLGERFGIPVIRERIFGQYYAKTLAIRRK